MKDRDDRLKTLYKNTLTMRTRFFFYSNDERLHIDKYEFYKNRQDFFACTKV